MGLVEKVRGEEEGRSSSGSRFPIAVRCGGDNVAEAREGRGRRLAWRIGREVMVGSR